MTGGRSWSREREIPTCAFAHGVPGARSPLRERGGDVADVVLGAGGIDAASVVAVARRGARVAVGPDADAALARGAAVVEELVRRPEPTYGITTGFGALANTVIPAERSAELQVALLRSHAAGMGPEIEREVVRAMMLLRARSLSMGFSGARREVVDGIVGLLNAGITPIVREHGSLGARTTSATPASRSAGGPGPDQWLAPRLEAVEVLVTSGALLAAANTALPAPLS